VPDDANKAAIDNSTLNPGRASRLASFAPAARTAASPPHLSLLNQAALYILLSQHATYSVSFPTMPTPESEILKPLDASNTNSDDWEIFVLSDARIVYESNGKPASLLAAYADTPLLVEGRLETPGRSQLKYRM
jgi:hypothetical protein